MITDGVLTIILAGGAGDRLQPLTKERSKGAVPFGGKFRLIDFTLSNCINSGLRRIFVLTQYLSESLNRHIQEGWAISSSGLGDYVYSIPAQQKLGADWYSGTADAVRQNLDLTGGKDVDDVLILSGDHIYKMNYRQFMAFHRMKKSALTIAALRVRKEQASRTLGVLQIDQENRLIGFEEKPVQPRTIPGAPDYALASMGVYAFGLSILKETLKLEGRDFGKHIIPGMIGKHPDIFVYDFAQENAIADFEMLVRDGTREKVLVERTHDSGFWQDVGSITSYYEASMDLVSINPSFSLYGERWPIRTYQPPLPPGKCILGGRLTDSIICDGCIISGGTVLHSVLSPSVIIERDAVVEDSVVFDGVIIDRGARIKRAIIDKKARIRAGVSIGYDLETDRLNGCTIAESGIVVVPKGADLA